MTGGSNGNKKMTLYTHLPLFRYNITQHLKGTDQNIVDLWFCLTST